MSYPHNALIYITLDLIGGEEKAKNIIKRINDCGIVSAISSVYKRYLTKPFVDLSARIEFVMHFETSMSVEQCLHLALSFSEQGQQGFFQKSHVELILLAYDHVVIMSPRLTLPYPLLHTDPLIIRCASEIWGTYEHPIFMKTLGEISRTASSISAVEFYTQGKSLVDF